MFRDLNEIWTNPSLNFEGKLKYSWNYFQPAIILFGGFGLLIILMLIGGNGGSGSKRKEVFGLGER